MASDTALGQTANLEVMATVEASCTLEGATLNFGTYRSEEPATTQATIGYNCPGDLTISLALSSGQNPQGRVRAMLRDGDDDLLPYQLYQDSARQQIWGDQADRLVIDSTDDGDASVEVYGQIEAGYLVPPGNYRDTVLITLMIE
ncbi:MAG: spore coat U domain-containing protein [Pseudomonadota bacterium]